MKTKRFNPLTMMFPMAIVLVVSMLCWMAWELGKLLANIRYKFKIVILMLTIIILPISLNGQIKNLDLKFTGKVCWYQTLSTFKMFKPHKNYLTNPGNRDQIKGTIHVNSKNNTVTITANKTDVYDIIEVMADGRDVFVVYKLLSSARLPLSPNRINKDTICFSYDQINVKFEIYPLIFNRDVLIQYYLIDGSYFRDYDIERTSDD